MDRLVIRRAGPVDAAGVAAVYSAGIAERTATFETEARTADDVLVRMASARPEHVTLVAVAVAAGPSSEGPSPGGAGDDTVVAAAWLSPYSPRPAYDGVAEFSVYVDAAVRGRAVGTLLLGALLQAARDGGLHKVTSRVLAENHTSRALMARLGFSEVGVHRRHARLDGAWRDCVVVERLLDEP